MLRWRCKVLPKLRRHFFWCKLFFVSIIGHLFLLFGLLFAYKGTYFSFAVTINRSALGSGAPVVFLPFRKTVKSASVVSSVQKRNKKPKQKSNKKTVVKKLAQKKIVQKKKKKNAKLKTLAVKKEAVKVAKKPKAKKSSKNKASRVAHKKAESKKNIEKVVQTQPVKESGDQPIYVGQLEMAAIQMQDEMHQEVSKSWKPPAGLPKDLQCCVKIVVDWNGRVHEAIVEKPSGVLMYDISARTAVAKLDELPRWARGKEFSITFKQ